MRIKVIKPTVAAENKRLKVCAYVRVSTDSLEQEDSLDNQTAYFKDYIQSNPAWEFVGIYADQGISGFKENRPQFQKMIADARAGKIDLIVVKSVSRFARNTETVLKFSRELKSIGVGIFFELQNINTLSGPGELMLTIIAAFAQAESQGASDNANLNYKRKFEAGMPVHDLKYTFGFDTDEGGNTYIIDPVYFVSQGLSSYRRLFSHRYICSPRSHNSDSSFRMRKPVSQQRNDTCIFEVFRFRKHCFNGFIVRQCCSCSDHVCIFVSQTFHDFCDLLRFFALAENCFGISCTQLPVMVDIRKPGPRKAGLSIYLLPLPGLCCRLPHLPAASSNILYP